MTISHDTQEVRLPPLSVLSEEEEQGEEEEVDIDGPTPQFTEGMIGNVRCILFLSPFLILTLLFLCFSLFSPFLSYSASRLISPFFDF